MPTTEAMRDIIVRIMVEVLGIFAIVTKEIKQGRASEPIFDSYLPSLIEIQRNTSRNYWEGPTSRMRWAD